MSEVEAHSTGIWPESLDKTRLTQILESSREILPLADRIDHISGKFLGSPYVQNPLVGSVKIPERFVCSCEGFDCVTFCETVLALSLSGRIEDFPELLRELRYSNGEIQWQTRNHYMHDWIERNRDKGFLQHPALKTLPIEVTRTLSSLDDFPAKIVNLQFLPHKLLLHNPSLAETGDIIFFGSTHSNLDVFHMGFLVQKEHDLILRHASKNIAKVFDQSLRKFINGCEMEGIFLLRPIERHKNASIRQI